MAKRFTKKPKSVTPDLDPATAAQQKVYDRLRKRQASALLKRRRRKSHQ